MNGKKVSVELGANSHHYKIEIGHDVLKSAGVWARKNLPTSAGKIAVFSNKKVFGLYGAKVVDDLRASGFETSVWLMGDGEKYKNWRSVEKALRFFSENRLGRTDAVIALGGGVVGDLAGFAAAIYLRGIAFLQIPTTLLAMIDSSVGGKTGVNSDFGKNLIGAFHQPDGVLIDVETLQTLPLRELTAGFCEAVKHGAISHLELFTQTAGFLENYPPKKIKSHFADDKFVDSLENLIAAQVSFKAQIVVGDEREDAARNDSKSRKILNFGHTFAHALEKVTNYRRFKHGEAVGLGILFAAELSKKLELLDQSELNLLKDVLQNVGSLPDASGIDLEKVFQSFVFDKKKIGKFVQYILLEKIGQPVIVSGEKISDAPIRQTLEKVLRS